mmetsp:Transcript_46664/g.93443  ORF Transcript_46664/g.93443 Transcript_46664/m.93443 type:complete len:114 (+) Transcript_46664:644-985(+)
MILFPVWECRHQRILRAKPRGTKDAGKRCPFHGCNQPWLEIAHPMRRHHLFYSFGLPAFHPQTVSVQSSARLEGSQSSRRHAVAPLIAGANLQMKVENVGLQRTSPICQSRFK